MIWFVANWKMAPLRMQDALKLAKATKKATLGNKKVRTIICVPHLYTLTVKGLKSKYFTIGAQDGFWGSTGAETGAISMEMLHTHGVEAVLIGHSESRARGETNESIIQKTKAALDVGILPIVCVGETERDHDGWYLHMIKSQIESLFSSFSKAQAKKIIIAYEPVWAIGNKAQREATPQECLEISLYIRRLLAGSIGEHAAHESTILYGGSVTPANASLFISEGGVQGLLVGRTSLDAKAVTQLVSTL